MAKEGQDGQVGREGNPKGEEQHADRRVAMSGENGEGREFEKHQPGHCQSPSGDR